MRSSGKRLHPVEDQRVFLGVDVIGDDGHRVALAHRLAQHFDQRRLAGAHRSADPNAQGSMPAHERNTREYWVSCFIAAMSESRC